MPIFVIFYYTFINQILLKQISYIFLILLFLLGQMDAFAGLENQEPIEANCPSNASLFADSIALALEGNDLNRASQLLYTWEQLCGLSEPVFRIGLLLDAATGNRKPELYGVDGLLSQAVSFEIRYRLMIETDEQGRKEYFELYPDYFGYVFINSAFDRKTQQLALQLLRDGVNNNILHAFVRLYAGETEWFFQNLKNGNLADSKLQQEYMARVQFFQQKPELSAGISTGLWVPMGNLDVVGLKPAFIVHAGVKKWSSSLHAVVAIRFGSTRVPIDFSIQDTLVSTRNQQGGFAGLEWVQGLYSRKKASLGITLTGGYDVIDMVEDRQDPRRKTFGSWFLQPGIFWEYALPNHSSLGLYPYFVFLNHKNTVNPSLDGNAWFVTLRYRLSGNVRKSENLKRLGY